MLAQTNGPTPEKLEELRKGTGDFFTQREAARKNAPETCVVTGSRDETVIIGKYRLYGIYHICAGGLLVDEKGCYNFTVTEGFFKGFKPFPIPNADGTDCLKPKEMKFPPLS